MSQRNEELTTILVTGGAGFIGSNFIPYYLEAHPSIRILNFDKLTYAGDLENLREVADHPRYRLVKADICDRAAVDHVFKENEIQGVIHFAAESHVDNSISGPGAFIQTNVVGTFNLIDAARQTWMEKPHHIHARYKNARFLHISTDEVYGTLGPQGLFTEDTPYAPNSPYSASKASSDLIVRSYHHTYGMNVVTTNCSNNYGPKQHKEKLIPTILRKALSKEPIPVYGQGLNIRDWLYVLDHCKGVDLAFAKGEDGQTYNIGGRNEWQNIKIVELICDLLDKKRPLNAGSYRQFISFVADRPGHDLRYAIDATKIENLLGWRAADNFASGIEKTVDWYLHKLENKG